ncbi:MAG: D-alanine--D-alanine ligase family protein [Candidatus Paceibacterota bacterium]
MTTDQKSAIGVFFGSRSPEHDVSIITAVSVIKGLREIGFSVVPVYISKDGRFFLGENTDNPADKTLARIDYFSDGLEKKLSKLHAYDLVLTESQGRLRFITETIFATKTVDIDIAFPCFHGPHGEDGALHGLFSLVDIPFVGPDQQASSVAMDKALTKLIYRQFDIPTTNFLYFTRREWKQYEEIILADLENFRLPLFVKPARAGSSIGITRVTNHDELTFAIEVALNYDDKVVVEEGVENVVDLTVCLLGDEVPEPSEVQESRFTSDFFSYDEKYIEDGGGQIGGAEKKIIIPAEISEEQTAQVKQLAVEIFTQFGLSGIARVDLLLDKSSGEIYANEINTMPGTLYKHLWEASGVPFAELLRSLIRSARRRHGRQADTSYVFDSNILTHISDSKLAKLDTETANEEQED